MIPSGGEENLDPSFAAMMQSVIEGMPLRSLVSFAQLPDEFLEQLRQGLDN
jgi:hypothetical protein